MATTQVDVDDVAAAAAELRADHDGRVDQARQTEVDAETEARAATAAFDRAVMYGRSVDVLKHLLAARTRARILLVLASDVLDGALVDRADQTGVPR